MNPEGKMTINERVNKHMVLNKIDTVVDLLKAMALKEQPWLEKHKLDVFETTITFRYGNLDINGLSVPYIKDRKNVKKIHYIIEEKTDAEPRLSITG